MTVDDIAARLAEQGDQPEPLFEITDGPRIGSLFSGYGGFDMAVLATLGGSVAWHAEYEPPTKSNPRPTQAAARILAHHHPGVPNHGDITAIDWDAVEPVDIVTGGFPCTDVSSAGLRLGLRPGTRSGLWTHMAYGIDRLRPQLVVIENVRGLLSADAACDVEPCPWCLGDDEGRPLRALGAVLGDLVELGYDAEWCGLRAADVGAPHGRFRVFIVAWPTAGNPYRFDLEGRGTTGLEGQAGPAAKDPAYTNGVGPLRTRGSRRGGGGPEDDGLTSTHTSRIGRGEGRPEPTGLVGGFDAPVGRDVPFHDASSKGCRERLGLHGAVGAAALGDGASSVAHSDRAALREQPVPVAWRGGAPLAGLDHETAPDADCDGCEERDVRQEVGQPAPHGGDAAGRVLDWGDYSPAVERWELILGRPAPAPTQTGARGGQQLSPAFVEWMMGLPKGHVTNVPGISRNDQLKALGNGVCPQQAEAALRWLLASDRRQVAA